MGDDFVKMQFLLCITVSWCPAKKIVLGSCLGLVLYYTMVELLHTEILLLSCTTSLPWWHQLCAHVCEALHTCLAVFLQCSCETALYLSAWFDGSA